MRRDGFDPVPDMAAMRDDEGVREVDTAFGMPAFLVARHADVKAVLADSARFSNDSRRAFDAPGAPKFSDEERERMRAGNLLGVDPPEHTRLRRMLTPEFTVRRMRRLEPRIIEIVDDHLDAMEKAGPPADLVADFALPIPSLVICELLGVPYADRAEFQERTSKLLDISLPMDERMDLGRESREYMADLVARAQAEPGDDMLGMLVREHGDDLTTDELIGIAGLLLIAGHETTSNMLGLGTLALLRHPDQLALVRDDPAAVAPAVEELLRFLGIVHSGIPRTTTEDVEVGGVAIPADSLVILALATANRDPRFRRRRRPPGHHPRRRRARRLRSRRAPLPGRAAGPDGDADRVPRAAAPLPRPEARRSLRGGRVPGVPLHLRAAVAARDLVRGRT